MEPENNERTEKTSNPYNIQNLFKRKSGRPKFHICRPLLDELERRRKMKLENNELNG